MSLLPPRFWRQQIGWSYCATSWTFGLVAWSNLNKKVSLSCHRRAAHSIAVLFHIWYAIAFQFDSHLGNFSFLFFVTFFKTFQSLRLGVRLSVWVSVRVSFWASVRATVRVKARVRLKVCLLCLHCFCQACRRQNLGSKIDTAINLS